MIDPKSGNEGNYDIFTEKDKIVKIGKNLRRALSEEALRGCDVIDASGLLAAPGLVDVHVHFREPGFTDKEDIDTGAKAAAKGGFTSVVMMANTNPAIDNRETLRQVLERGRGTGIRVYSCVNVTMGMKGEKITPMEELAKEGAVGFTDDGIPIMEAGVLKEAMERAAVLDMPISLHEEDPKLIENNGINKGAASEYFGVGGTSREAEIVMIRRDLELALQTGACLNIQHISTAEGVELVRQAKKKGHNIHAEATPHHFTLTEEALIRCGSAAKMNPPLRTGKDREEIICGLKDGTIDIIATDHAPHTEAEKAQPITVAPSGLIGLETSLALGITGLVNGGYLTMKELLTKMSANPAAMYHLDAGYLAEGGPADIVLIDPAAGWEAGDYVSKASNSPFTGWFLKGLAVRTICGGKTVYQR